MQVNATSRPNAVAKTDDDNVTETFTTFTNASSHEMYYDHYNPGTPFDIAMDVFLILALAISLCLLLSLCWYEVVLRRSRDANALTVENKCRIGPWLRILCILSAMFSLLRCINDIMYYKTNTMGSERCTVLKNIGVSWLVGVDTTVYLFLWLRQRVLYSKRSMKHLENKLTFFSSWLALFLIVAIFVIMNALLGWRKYTYVPVIFKCRSIKNFVESALPATWAVSASFLHLILAALYIYPLVRQTARLDRGRMNASLSPAAGRRLASVVRRNRRHEVASATSCATTASGATTAPSSGKRNLMDVVLRCVIISLVCIISDGLTIILSEFVITAPEHTKLRHSLYNYNIILNVIAIVCSFRKWDRMLLPWLKLRSNKKTKTPENATRDAGKQDSTSSMLPSAAGRT